MCSIFGVVCYGEPSDAVARATQVIWHKSEGRGRDSYGRVAVDRYTGEIFRSSNHKETFLPTKDFIAVGNRRGEPTTEWVKEKSDRDVQPFTSPSGRYIFTHNGTIANDSEIGEKCGIEKDKWPTQVDSYAIGVALDKYGWYTTIRDVLKGSFAILCVDLNGPPDGLLAATNYKPMFVRGWENRRYTVVASQRSYLVDDPEDWLNTSGFGIVEIPPYSVARIGTQGVTIEGTLYPEPAPQWSGSRVAVVCSGGLDSATVAWDYHKRGAKLDLLHFQYGCKAQDAELLATYKLAQAMNATVTVIPLDFFQKHAQSVLTDDTKSVNHEKGGVAGAEIAHEWVPARNLIMMALAMGWCEANGVHRLALGTNLEESGAYPDNEPEFLNKLQAITPYALRPYHQLSIETPVGDLMKHEIVARGLLKDMPYDLTWSCYEGGAKHCGTCGPCSMRKTAFAMNGALDPVFTTG